MLAYSCAVVSGSLMPHDKPADKTTGRGPLENYRDRVASRAVFTCCVDRRMAKTPVTAVAAYGASSFVCSCAPAARTASTPLHSCLPGLSLSNRLTGDCQNCRD